MGEINTSKADACSWLGYLVLTSHRVVSMVTHTHTHIYTYTYLHIVHAPGFPVLCNHLSEATGGGLTCSGAGVDMLSVCLLAITAPRQQGGPGGSFAGRLVLSSSESRGPRRGRYPSTQYTHDAAMIRSSSASISPARPGGWQDSRDSRKRGCGVQERISSHDNLALRCVAVNMSPL